MRLSERVLITLLDCGCGDAATGGEANGAAPGIVTGTGIFYSAEMCASGCAAVCAVRSWIEVARRNEGMLPLDFITECEMAPFSRKISAGFIPFLILAKSGVSGRILL